MSSTVPLFAICLPILRSILNNAINKYFSNVVLDGAHSNLIIMNDRNSERSGTMPLLVRHVGIRFLAYRSRYINNIGEKRLNLFLSTLFKIFLTIITRYYEQ